MFLLQMRKPHRRLLALVAFCYLCLSIVLPLQHTDHLVPPSMSFARHVVSGRSARSDVHAGRSALPYLSRQDRCSACDWQAAHVSLAVPAFTLVLTPPQAVLALTLPLRALRLPTFPASSRAPPLA